MTVVLYDLVGRDDRRFSPNCWRTRMALAHKGLDCEARPTRFIDIKAIGDGQCRTVPVIEDGGRLVVDSWAIATHLERTYPETPSLFGGSGGEPLTRFVSDWCTAVLHGAIVPLIVLDVYERLVPEDQDYFRTTRERRFGRTLEDVQAGREGRVEDFRRTLQPLRMTLEDRRFLGGERPLYADHLVFGAFQWARVASPLRLLAEDDPITVWFERCLELYDGLGRKALGAA